MFHSFLFFGRRERKIWLFFRETNKLKIYLFILTGGLTKDLREYLTTRFAKGSVDHELQTTIRDNLYLRTVPVTTRPRRPGETDGLDYTFLSLEQFRLLEKNGSLLERGIYDGKRNSPLQLRIPQSIIFALIQARRSDGWTIVIGISGFRLLRTLYRWN
ncbi:hypothetical protein DAPPUDRAFT_44014 [Daphnia pulex]|uniref:Guanylate kinase-like domain-containing protein n=1 Tax=Daphnia pulex TaxID=6669 RepID=E9G071_DAPPU|nr:hypothetical protein DAPPUDRAFT_44014 [Daphnia pulex]|eukprot:EFX86849.1 hypothetical protein DAPPUDRAFT_44014 [Daphnia pulex]